MEYYGLECKFDKILKSIIGISTLQRTTRVERLGETMTRIDRRVRIIAEPTALIFCFELMGQGYLLCILHDQISKDNVSDRMFFIRDAEAQIRSCVHLSKFVSLSTVNHDVSSFLANFTMV